MRVQKYDHCIRQKKGSGSDPEPHVIDTSNIDRTNNQPTNNLKPRRQNVNALKTQDVVYNIYTIVLM